ncbi:MAG: elongation factor Tu [Thaumarchaeota archaeon]|nr:MAG: elongation factor Tu [Nitrososphaerota archaeon]
MKSINYAILGDESIAKDFGKKGTATDITIYDRKETDVLRTWTAPSTFPDKIPPLFQALNMAEYVIFHVTKLDKFTGEQIVALDVLNKTRGVLSHSFEVDRNTLLSMIKGTVVEQYKLVEFENIKKEVDLLQPISKDGTLKITIDHCFDVKGVGTVILGKVTRGKVRVYENLKLVPKGVDVVIKSIQMHDDPVEEAASPARVGLSVKGIIPDDVQRGDLLCMPDTVTVSQEIELDYIPNKFFKEKIAENQTFLVNIGLQIRPAKITTLNPMRLSLGKPVVYEKGEICVILKPESTSIRIVGSGKIK